MDGFFHPAVMTSQMFTYLIDNVPGCATAYTTMFIQENSTPNPGLATSILACSNGVPFNLFAQLDGNPTAGGVWTNPNNQLDQINNRLGHQQSQRNELDSQNTE